MTRKISIGDTVKVVNNGSQYTGYDTWARHHGLDMFKERAKIYNGVEGEVVAKGSHLTDTSTTVLGIRVGGQEFIIREDGCELVKYAAFAVGDVVKLVDGDGGDEHLVGTERVVTKVTQLVNTAGSYISIYNERFELVSRADPEYLVNLPPYTVTYPDGSAVTFEVGDEVEVVRDGINRFAVDGMGSSGKWDNGWAASMKIGTISTISKIHSSGAQLVGEGFGWPLTALRNLTKQPKTVGELLKAKIDAMPKVNLPPMTPPEERACHQMMSNMTASLPANGVDASGKPMQFGPDDLKPFMKVKTERGDVGFVIERNGNIIVVYVSEGSGFDYPMFADNNPSCGENNIVAVYQETRYTPDIIDEAKFGKLLWKAVDTAQQKRLTELEAAVDIARSSLSDAINVLQDFRALQA